MAHDIFTVMWQEWKELLQFQRSTLFPLSLCLQSQKFDHGYCCPVSIALS